MKPDAQHHTELPDGPLVAWYGDDFTGASAVAEVLTFSGLPSVLFLETPTPDRLSAFSDHRGIGIAGDARAQSPAWMERELPTVFDALERVGAPLVHYKICSTFDSARDIGSIGKAIDIGSDRLGGDWHPLLTAAPPIGRYQAFGNLFANAGGTVYRLDRHPTMSRHPVTPMDEADLGRHLSLQTDRAIGLIDLLALKAGRAAERLEAELAAGSRVVSLDVVDEDTLREAGRLVWQNRGSGLLALGSQGLEYALVAHWRAEGLLSDIPAATAHPGNRRVAAVSGSCSPVTAEQLEWAADHGFAVLAVEAARAVDEAAWEEELDRAAGAALEARSAGRDVILATAFGPDDPSTKRLLEAQASAGIEADTVNRRIGDGLGRALGRILRTSGTERAVIAGGDTSSFGARALGLHALTALAPIASGSALFDAHGDDPKLNGLQIALKGGQMGGPDFFGRVREGGAAPSTDLQAERKCR